MQSLLGILFIYFIFRYLDIATDKNKKKKKTDNIVKNSKKITFEEIADEISTNINNKLKNLAENESLEKTDIKELKRKLKEKHKEKIQQPIVSSDRNIKMRHGENSLEGLSLETNIDNESLVKPEEEIFDRVYTKQIQEMKKDREEKRAIRLGEKNLKVENISKEDLQRGFVFQEILSKPVSLR